MKIEDILEFREEDDDDCNNPFDEVNDEYENVELNKEPKDNVRKISILAVLRDELEFGKFRNVTKLVHYHSGVEIDMRDKCRPIPYNFNIQVMNCINNVKKAVSHEFGDKWVDKTPVQVMICIETLEATYRQEVCEHCIGTLYTWLLRVYEDIYGVDYEMYFEDFDWFD